MIFKLIDFIDIFRHTCINSVPNYSTININKKGVFFIEKRKQKQYFSLLNVIDRSVNEYIIPNALTPHRLQSKHKSLGSECYIETPSVQYWTKMIKH